MLQFQFRLQPLLDAAMHKERGLQLELVRAQAAETEARANLEATLRLRAEWEKRIRQNQRGQLDPRVLRDLIRALEAVRQKAAVEKEALRAAELATEECRARLAEATKARKSLERLRERLEAEFAAACRMQQTKTLDEMAAVRAATKAVERNDTAVSGVPT